MEWAFNWNTTLVQRNATFFSVVLLWFSELSSMTWDELVRIKISGLLTKSSYNYDRYQNNCIIPSLALNHSEQIPVSLIIALRSQNIKKRNLFQSNLKCYSISIYPRKQCFLIWTEYQANRESYELIIWNSYQNLKFPWSLNRLDKKSISLHTMPSNRQTLDCSRLSWLILPKR